MAANYVFKEINDEEYKNKCVIAPAPKEAKTFYSPFEPPYSDVKHLFYNFFIPYVQPYEYTGWRDEQLSWEKTVYLHAGLSCSPYYRFQGPDATKFMMKHAPAPSRISRSAPESTLSPAMRRVSSPATVCCSVWMKIRMIPTLCFLLPLTIRKRLPTMIWK